MAVIHVRTRLDFGGFNLDVDLLLPGNGISVLFGPSGSGKTTLLRCIAGLEPSAKGYININGNTWQDSERGLFLPAYQRPLGYVFQDANLFPHLTVRENLNFGLKRIQQKLDTPQCAQIIELLGIGHLMERLPENLSGGERQRVAIARALALNPNILLMDEPLAALDFKRKMEILPFFIHLHQALSIPILYVTHAQQEVAQLADYLVILAEGRITRSGLPAETLARIDSPAQERQQAFTVWQVSVVEHDAEFFITRAAFDGGVLNLPLVNTAIGTPLRIQIDARDVSIALQKPSATSILNVLSAVINEISSISNGQLMVQLQVGSQLLLAHITSKSATLLGLRAAMAVFVQIKSTSLLH